MIFYKTLPILFAAAALMLQLPFPLVVILTAAWMIIWWIKQPVPVAITALLPLLIFPFSGELGLAEISKSYADPVIFLFLSGFMLAIALEKHELHKHLVSWLVRLAPLGAAGLSISLLGSTALLSMWISNTATALMMLPVASSVLHQLLPFCTNLSRRLAHQRFGMALMLGIAYAANIGGTATLIGTPPNVVFAGISQQLTGSSPGFGSWMLVGVPFALCMLVIGYFVLFKWQYKSDLRFESHEWASIRRALVQTNALNSNQKRVAFIFTLTALGWMGKDFLRWQFGVDGLNDTNIGLGGALLMFLVPAKDQKTGLLIWDDMKQLPWGILLLFGGGIGLAKGLESSGLILAIGEAVRQISLEHSLLLILLLSVLSLLLTELMSNVALIAVFLPIVIGIAQGMAGNIATFTIPVTLAASCAFMMPISTPPNAIVFGSGYITASQMLRTGVWMNLIAILLLVFLVAPLAARVF
jgi:solute carrier family 13 (sodium-dependent dicarboxylate transporter), member 2/3/5